MNDRLEQMRNAFFEEAEELLAELETCMLELEASPDSADLLGRAFRALHTLKGSGAMFGLDDISGFAHHFEGAFDKVRNGEIPVTKNLISLSLASGDHIRGLVDAARSGRSPDRARSAELLDALAKLTPGQSVASTAGTQAKHDEAAGEETARRATYRIRFRPAMDIFKSGTNPLLILSELAELGRYSAVALTEDIPELDDFDPERCYMGWDITLTTDAGENAIRDAFIFVEDTAEIHIGTIDDGSGEAPADDRSRIGDILLDRGDVKPEDVKEVVKERKLMGEALIERGSVKASAVASALAEQEHLRQVRKERESTEATSSIRVASSKLDKLVNLIGELVIVQARISQNAISRDDLELITMAEELERLTADLRDNSLDIRMVPIGSTFSRFQRLVRDLSNELGKKVDLTTEGAETELDKTVIERLNDPLVHMIRNSVDHGVEAPAIREAAGKPAKGRIHLAAVHSGAQVLITISDDGKGLDPAVIRNKAVEKGLIAPDATLSDEEIFGLIFAAGFSTAEKVTGVSGRGVGMDVVKRSIDALRGRVRLSSQKGVGTTFTIELPLTLAIIEGLQVEIGEDAFVFPLSIVEECIELTESEINKAHGRRYMNVRGEILPYIRLREWFDVPGQPGEIETIVVVNAAGRRVGFVVDRVIGEYQTVIKNLGSVYRNIKGLSGATIQGNGRVALILDIPALVTSVEAAETGLVGNLST